MGNFLHSNGNFPEGQLRTQWEPSSSNLQHVSVNYCEHAVELYLNQRSESNTTSLRHNTSPTQTFEDSLGPTITLLYHADVLMFGLIQPLT